MRMMMMIMMMPFCRYGELQAFVIVSVLVDAER